MSLRRAQAQGTEDGFSQSCSRRSILDARLSTFGFEDDLDWAACGARVGPQGRRKLVRGAKTGMEVRGPKLRRCSCCQDLIVREGLIAGDSTLQLAYNGSVLLSMCCGYFTEVLAAGSASRAFAALWGSCQLLRSLRRSVMGGRSMGR